MLSSYPQPYDTQEMRPDVPMPLRDPHLATPTSAVRLRPRRGPAGGRA